MSKHLEPDALMQSGANCVDYDLTNLSSRIHIYIKF